MEEFVTFPPFFMNEKGIREQYDFDDEILYIEDEDWAYAVTVYNKENEEYTKRYHLVTDIEEFIQDYKKNK